MFIFALTLLLLLPAQLHTNLKPKLVNTRIMQCNTCCTDFKCYQRGKEQESRWKHSDQADRMDEPASGPGLHIQDHLCWDQVSCLTSPTEEQDKELGIVFCRSLHISVQWLQTPRALLNSGKSAGFRTRLRTKSPPAADSTDFIWIQTNVKIRFKPLRRRF